MIQRECEPISSLTRPIPFDGSFINRFDYENSRVECEIKSRHYDNKFVDTGKAYAFVRTYDMNCSKDRMKYARYETTYQLLCRLGGSAPVHVFGDNWIASRALRGYYPSQSNEILIDEDEFFKQMAKHICVSDIDRSNDNTICTKSGVYFIDQGPIQNWDSDISNWLKHMEKLYHYLFSKPVSPHFIKKLGRRVESLLEYLLNSPEFISQANKMKRKSDTHRRAIEQKEENMKTLDEDGLSTFYT